MSQHHNEVVKNFREAFVTQGDEQSHQNIRGTVTPATIMFDTGTTMRSFPYSFLLNLGFENGAIHLQFNTGEVVIHGKNLQPLFMDINRYITSMVQLTPKDKIPSNDAMVIEDISIAMRVSV